MILLFETANAPENGKKLKKDEDQKDTFSLS